MARGLIRIRHPSGFRIIDIYNYRIYPDRSGSISSCYRQRMNENMRDSLPHHNITSLFQTSITH